MKVFQFPPNRKPRLGKLSRGITYIVYLTDAKSVVGEFDVEDVKLVDASEFEKCKDRAYESQKHHFRKVERNLGS